MQPLLDVMCSSTNTWLLLLCLVAPGRVAVFGPQTPGSSTNYTFTFLGSNGTVGDQVDLIFVDGIFPGILGDGKEQQE
jgi:hypothetical protein